MREDWNEIERAPKGRRGGKAMSAGELAHAILLLALAGRVLKLCQTFRPAPGALPGRVQQFRPWEG